MTKSNARSAHEELHSAITVLRHKKAEAVDNFVTTLSNLNVEAESLKTAKLSDHMFMAINILPTELSTVGVGLALTALQDSGALDASYIRNDIVQSNAELRKRIQPCNMNVLLADGDVKTKLHIDAFIEVDFTCADANGKTHTVKKVPLLIVPKLSVDVILGLPAIVLNMPQVFISHLMAAIAAAHARQLEADKAQLTGINSLILPEGRDHSSLIRPETALHTLLGTDFTVLTLNIRGNRTALCHDIPQFLRKTKHDALVLTEIGLKSSEHPQLQEMLQDLGYTSFHIHSSKRQEGVCIATKTVDPPRYLTADTHTQGSRILIAVFPTGCTAHGQILVSQNVFINSGTIFERKFVTSRATYEADAISSSQETSISQLQNKMSCKTLLLRAAAATPTSVLIYTRS